VIPSRSLHRLAPLVRHPSVTWVKPGYHLPHCPNFQSPLCREENQLVDHLVNHGNEIVFMDSRLITGRYELPLLEDAYIHDRVLSSVLRARAHAILRRVLTAIQGCYRLEEQGPVISAYRRVSKTCLQ